MRLSRLTFLAVLFFATAAHAQFARYGDLLVDGDCRDLPCPAYIVIVSPATLIRSSFEVGPMGYAPYAVATVPDGAIVVANGLKRFSRAGEELGAYPTEAAASSITFDAVGFLYASTDAGVLKIGRDGVVDTFPIGARTIDLAADQCTLFFTQRFIYFEPILRYDVCRHRALPDFHMPAVRAVSAFRLLRDGTMLVAGDALYHVAADGSILGEYSKQALSVALTTDGKSAWISNGKDLVLVDIASMNEIVSYESSWFVFSVYGEQRASYDVARRSRLTRRR